MKAEASLAIEFQSGKSIGASKGKWGNSPKAQEVIALEEQQYLLMRSLKRGGKDV